MTRQIEHDVEEASKDIRTTSGGNLAAVLILITGVAFSSALVMALLGSEHTLRAFQLSLALACTVSVALFIAKSERKGFRTAALETLGMNERGRLVEPFTLLTLMASVTTVCLFYLSL